MVRLIKIMYIFFSLIAIHIFVVETQDSNIFYNNLFNKKYNLVLFYTSDRDFALANGITLLINELDKSIIIKNNNILLSTVDLSKLKQLKKFHDPDNSPRLSLFINQKEVLQNQFKNIFLDFISNKKNDKETSQLISNSIDRFLTEIVSIVNTKDDYDLRKKEGRSLVLLFNGSDKEISIFNQIAEEKVEYCFIRTDNPELIEEILTKESINKPNVPSYIVYIKKIDLIDENNTEKGIILENISHKLHIESFLQIYSKKKVLEPKYMDTLITLFYHRNYPLFFYLYDKNDKNKVSNYLKLVNKMPDAAVYSYSTIDNDILENQEFENILRNAKFNQRSGVLYAASFNGISTIVESFENDIENEISVIQFVSSFYESHKPSFVKNSEVLKKLQDSQENMHIDTEYNKEYIEEDL